MLDSVEPVDGGWLDAGERRRLERLTRVESRREFVTARVLLKTLIGGLSGMRPTDVRLAYTCNRCGEPHGRPVITAPDVATSFHVSVAHSGNRVVVAASTAGPVGVDVEPLSATLFDGFDDVALSARERRRLLRMDEETRPAARAAYWVRKEALLKARGNGLTLDPAGIDVSRPPAQLRDLDLGDGYATALRGAEDQPRPFARVVGVDRDVRRTRNQGADDGDVEIRCARGHSDPDAVTAADACDLQPARHVPGGVHQVGVGQHGVTVVDRRCVTVFDGRPSQDVDQRPFERSELPSLQRVHSGQPGAQRLPRGGLRRLAD
jgi:phosphopantetheinyl transferase